MEVAVTNSRAAQKETHIQDKTHTSKSRQGSARRKEHCRTESAACHAPRWVSRGQNGGCLPTPARQAAAGPRMPSPLPQAALAAAVAAGVAAAALPLLSRAAAAAGIDGALACRQRPPPAAQGNHPLQTPLPLTQHYTKVWFRRRHRRCRPLLLLRAR